MPSCTDLFIQTLDGDIPARLAAPASTQPSPGVVVIHDALGMTQDICGELEWLEDSGYLAVAPDL